MNQAIKVLEQSLADYEAEIKAAIGKLKADEAVYEPLAAPVMQTYYRNGKLVMRRKPSGKKWTAAQKRAASKRAKEFWAKKKATQVF